ncbi:BadF/BadG/BcrA/BcrD ATPase family protein [Litchfieldella rifensis]|uniref:BadF/BadG/BcrA/BcrD ATPase family protein n=1 Tax=Litchfieldella rifensis TaxID=762643 RepID=A0ABV7LND8_9GAMM
MTAHDLSATPNAIEPLYLGVDGGGTHCRARLYDSLDRPLGEGQSGSASVRHGMKPVWEHILQAAQEALGAAGLTAIALSRIHAGLGLAGAVNAEERRKVLAFPHPFASVQVASDAHTAVLGAFGGNDGGILIIGTGSCGMALVHGRFRSLGGWGFPISDHASGAWLGLLALRAALLSHENLRPPSVLTKRLLQAFDNDIMSMVRWQYSAQPCDYASFAPEVFTAAEEGDALAGELLDQAVDDATMLAEGVLNLGVERLCLLGSVGQALAPLLGNEIRRRLASPCGDALDGARLLARSPDFEP